MKIKLSLSLILLLSNSNIFAAATEKTVTNNIVINVNKGNITLPSSPSKKSLFSPEGFEVKPYYSVFAENSFRFTSAALGVEATFNVNKYIGISLDALGKDDAEKTLIDRAGVALTTTLPLNRSFALYGQGGFGYWTGNVDEFDMVLRVGLKYKFTKNLSASTDFGQGAIISGIRDNKSGSYQQIRAGLGLNF